MNRIAAIIIALSMLTLAQTKHSLQGGATWGVPVLWSTGDDTTTALHFADDSISIGEAGEWVRIDDIADSCSLPFYITAGEYGPRPLGRMILHHKIDTVTRTDANAVSYYMQTRMKKQLKNSAGQYVQSWTPWVPAGMEQAYTEEEVVDTLTTTVVSGVDDVQEILKAWRFGDQGRLCPDIPSASNFAADTLTADSLFWTFQ